MLISTQQPLASGSGLQRNVSQNPKYKLPPTRGNFPRTIELPDQFKLPDRFPLPDQFKLPDQFLGPVVHSDAPDFIKLREQFQLPDQFRLPIEHSDPPDIIQLPNQFQVSTHREASPRRQSRLPNQFQFAEGLSEPMPPTAPMAGLQLSSRLEDVIDLTTPLDGDVYNPVSDIDSSHDWHACSRRSKAVYSTRHPTMLVARTWHQRPATPPLWKEERLIVQHPSEHYCSAASTHGSFPEGYR